MAEVIAGLGGILRCHATTEPRLQACRASIPDPDAGGWSVTASLVDDQVGVALLAATLPAIRISHWHDQLSRRYGDVPVRRRPGQESFQWIRGRQMLRLTVHRDANELTASVSLVDGRLLDSLPPP